MQAEVDEARISHGAAAEKRTAILTPLNRHQKQKAAEAAFCVFKHRISPARGCHREEEALTVTLPEQQHSGTKADESATTLLSWRGA
jgi:hypothetical protein